MPALFSMHTNITRTYPRAVHFLAGHLVSYASLLLVRIVHTRTRETSQTRLPFVHYIAPLRAIFMPAASQSATHKTAHWHTNGVTSHA